MQRALFFTVRLPESVEWVEAAAGASHSRQLLLIVNKGAGKTIGLDRWKQNLPSVISPEGC